MNVCISSHLRRFGFRCLLTFAAAVSPIVARAGDFDCGSDFTYSATSATPCDFELDGTEELCGWGDDCPLGTHDSSVLPTPAGLAIIPPAPVASPAAASTSLLNKSVSAIATAAFASAGVSVEQIVEPFAMVGPYLDDSLQMVQDFQAWWETAQAEAVSMKTAADAIQDELDRIAAQEPVDVESFGPSVIVNQLPTKQTAIGPSRIQVTAIDALIGSSPIIATIKDDYRPYDLSARDLKLWSVFPTSTHPFCVRSHMDALDDSPMWEDFDRAVQADTDVAPSVESFAFAGSADCLLYELIWQFDTWTADDSPVWTAVEPRNIGRRFAAIATDGNRIVQGAAQLLASNWPEPEVENEPSSTGEALLARAGAVNASEPVAANTTAAVQIAKIPSETTLR